MVKQTEAQALIIAATRAWLESVVIKHNFCPFAGSVLADDRIRFVVITENQIENCLTAVLEECEYLESNQQFETSLLIVAQIGQDFDSYLQLLQLAEQLIIDQGYEGIYQLASFHPQYQFANSDQQDPANYTNRSPYPMLHLLRESSIEKAVSTFERPEEIPQRNIVLTRQLGNAALQKMLDACIR